MKNNKFGIFGALVLGAGLFFAGCTDPCKDVVCNNGECVEGECVCDAGYEGVDCATAFNAKFSGTYTNSEVCDSTPDVTYNVTIAPSSAEPARANITGLYEEPATSVSAVIGDDGVTFTIPSTNIGTTSYGRIETVGNATSNADGSQITITYKYTNNTTGFTENCTGTLTRQ